MSLLKKASIITTPTAYAEDFLYNIKPAGGLGDELVTNGTFDTDSNWTKGAGTTISGGKANFSSATDVSLYQNIGTQSSIVQVTFSVTDYTSGTLNVYSGSNQSVGTINVTANAIGQYTAYVDRSGGNNNIIFGSSNSFTGSIDNVSIKEVVDFDFDRNSTGTRVNEDYLIEDVPYNLAKYSQDLSGGAWSNTNSTESLDTSVLAPDGTATAWKLQASAATGFSFILQAITMTGQNTFSCFLKKGTSSTASMFFSEAGNFGLSVNLDTGTITNTGGSDMTSSVESAGNGWYRFHISHTSGNDLVNQIRIGVADGALASATYAGTENIYVWGAQVTKGGIKDYLKTTDRLDIPRIDYTNGEPSILLEPSSTNLVTYSEDFSQWDKSDATITSSSFNAPDGTQNASILTTSASGGTVQDNLTVSNGNVTFSVFVKKGTTNGVRLRIDAATDSNGYFDLVNNTVHSSTNGAKIENYGNGWYRVSISDNITSFVKASIYTTDGTTSYDNGTLHIWGAQVEQLSYATSYIPTNGSAVTRSADVANNAGNSDLINSTEGVLYAEIKALADDGTNRTIALNKDTNDRIQLYFNTSTNGLSVFYKAQSTTSFIMNETLSDATEFNKIAFKWKANDFALWVNGTETDTVSSGVTPNADTLNALEFEMFNDSSQYYGNVKCVAVFKEALTDTELACLTGYNSRELYLNYYNRLSYLGLAEEYNVESDINNYIL